MKTTHEELSSFETWLRNRQIQPSFSILSEIRRKHNGTKISIYSVRQIIDSLGLDMNIFRATIYLHNQYFPCFTEEEIQMILSHFEQVVENSEGICTSECILSIIGGKCNIDTEIRTMECPICLENLRWHDKGFDDYNHHYCEECMPKTCIICNRK